MSQSGAKASRDIRQMAAQHAQESREQEVHDATIKFECHQRAVAATTTFVTLGTETQSIPKSKDEQMAYAKELYDWVMGVTE